MHTCQVEWTSASRKGRQVMHSHPSKDEESTFGMYIYNIYRHIYIYHIYIYIYHIYIHNIYTFYFLRDLLSWWFFYGFYHRKSPLKPPVGIFFWELVSPGNLSKSKCIYSAGMRKKNTSQYANFEETGDPDLNFNVYFPLLLGGGSSQYKGSTVDGRTPKQPAGMYKTL